MSSGTEHSQLRLRPTNALVVGAGLGLGRACALTFAHAGADVVCVDIDADRAASVAAEITALGRRAHPVAVDILERGNIEHVVSEAIAALGGIDACVDVVGMAFRGDILDFDDETWDRNFAMNLRQSFRVTQLVARHMVDTKTRGSIVHVSSISAWDGHANNGAYAAAKAGLNSLIRTASVELGPHGVRINGVAPGTIDTPRLHTDATADRRAALSRSVPMGYQGTPEDIANLAVFLASDLAGYVSGQVILVDGAVNNVFPLIDGKTWRPAEV